MSKKVLYATLIALVMVASLAGAALAASNEADSGHPPGPGRGRGPGGGLRGEVIDVGSNEFTMEALNGSEVNVTVDDETRYVGDLESFADIEVGMQVGVHGQRDGEGGLLAKGVASGDILDATRTRGEVTAVGSASLTIETREGESLTFQVDSDTVFHSRDGEVESLSDIKVGDHALILYDEEGSNLLAKVIGVGGPKGEGPPAGDEAS